MKSSKIKFAFENRLRSGAPLTILGVNSGTSADGLNLVLAEFGGKRLPKILSGRVFTFERKLRNRIVSCSEPGFADGSSWLELDGLLGRLYGNKIEKFIREQSKSNARVDLIASHGQTVRHIPEKLLTLQLGNPATIAGITGLPVISGFRHSDIAAGGQGAPLSPVLHEYLFRDIKKSRAIVNIGGIANITVLPNHGSKRLPFAADCGPGNMVIDKAMLLLFRKVYDKDGKIALSGKSSTKIVSAAMKNRFFRLRPPKSTGREMFGADFVDSIMRKTKDQSSADIIATVSEITVMGIVGFVRDYARSIEEIYLCGGGAKNRYISTRISEELPRCTVLTTSALGYDPDYIEPLLWSYLAYLNVNRVSVNTGKFTGSKRPYIPGAIWLP